MASDERVVRFAVADAEGRRLSSPWRVWSKDDDHYVAVRFLSGEFKTSLHGDKFRHGFATDEASVRVQGPGHDRAVVKWDRPQPQVPGATLLLRIIIPGSELGGSLPTEELPADFIRLPPPPPDHVLYVSIMETEASFDMEGVEFPKHVIKSWLTSQGGKLWVVAHEAPIGEAEREALRHLREGLRARRATAELDYPANGPPCDLRSVVPLASAQVGVLIDLYVETLGARNP
jgi:hypothetical protein